MKRFPEENRVEISLEGKVYPIEAIYSAAYIFIDRFYIYLDREKGRVKVSIKGKKVVGMEEVEDAGGEFLNELLDQSLRLEISKRAGRIRDYIVARALFSSRGMTIEGALEEAEEDWQADPLGIAVPWEEKYGKGKKRGDQ